MPIHVNKSAGVTYAALFVTGVVTEIVVVMITGAKESWDHSLYWSIGIPVMIAANGIAGFAGNGHSLMHGMVTIAGQIFAMMIRSGEAGSMIVPGIILSIILGGLVSIGSFGGKKLKYYLTQR